MHLAALGHAGEGKGLPVSGERTRPRQRKLFLRAGAKDRFGEGAETGTRGRVRSRTGIPFSSSGEKCMTRFRGKAYLVWLPSRFQPFGNSAHAR